MSSQSQAELSPDISGTIDVENGTRFVYYEYYGSPDNGAETACLMNGLAMDCKSWRGFLPQIYPAYNVLLFNFFGQGVGERQSSCEDEPYSIAGFARYLTEIMDLLKVEKIHAMGVSYGGFVCAEFARAYPERVHTATVSGILLTRELGFQHYQDLSLHFYTSTDEVFATYTRYLYEKIFGDRFLAKIYGETMEKMRASFLERYGNRRYCLIRLTEAQNPFFDAIDENPQRYSELPVPLLTIAGGHDRAIPLWYQEKIPAMNPGSRYIILPECGHMTYMERPELFWPSLREFWRTKDTAFDAGF